MIFVDFDAITSNALLIKNVIGNKKLCAVVKNNAYGHGLTQVAKAISDVADMFAVGSVDDAVNLLSFGKQVLVLLPANKVDTIRSIANDLVLTVDSFATLQLVKSCAKTLGRVANVHIKIDTGMHRLGFDSSQLVHLLPMLADDNILVKGVFSHFACADSDKAFTDSQFDIFCRATNQLENTLGKSLVKHIANTSATFSDSKYHLDMVRVGLGLYGYGDNRLTVAKSVTAKVVAIKHLKQGDYVGYGAKYVCSHNTKVAVLDAGYADGISKNFSDICVAKINGKPCRQIGNVCMGMMMVDVTEMDVSIGDIAVLFGKNTTWNKDVFMYETLCNTR